MQTSGHTSEFGRWTTTQRKADPRLRAHVHGYFASSSTLPNPVRERHLPSAEVPLLLNFGAPHRRFDTYRGVWTERDGAWVVGLHESHQLSEAVGVREFMVVRFTPIGASLFLGVPMHLIAGQAVALEQLDPSLERLVIGRVGVATSWSDRFAAMESLIVERVSGRAIPGAIAWAWERLRATDGRIAMRSLAADMECSHRHAIAQFRTSIGLPPKTIARLFRFNRAVRSLNGLSRASEPAGKPYIEAPGRGLARSEAVGWADVAAQSGYFDQAHFIREFRHFAGTTPTGFLHQMADVA